MPLSNECKESQMFSELKEKEASLENFTIEMPTTLDKKMLSQLKLKKQ